jgi:hypothetical protein
MSTITLYRPVGQKELELIAASDYKAFPPRLPDQPIFYPVIALEYAEQIARDWNTRDERVQSSHSGRDSRDPPIYTELVLPQPSW